MVWCTVGVLMVMFGIFLLADVAIELFNKGFRRTEKLSLFLYIIFGIFGVCSGLMTIVRCLL